MLLFVCLRALPFVSIRRRRDVAPTYRAEAARLGLGGHTWHERVYTCVYRLNCSSASPRRKLYACGYSEYACEYSEYPGGYSEYACEYSEYPCGYPEYACSGNVICLDVLRAIKREPASAAGEYSEYPAVSTLPRMHVCTSRVHAHCAVHAASTPETKPPHISPRVAVSLVCLFVCLLVCLCGCSQRSSPSSTAPRRALQRSPAVREAVAGRFRMDKTRRCRRFAYA